MRRREFIAGLGSAAAWSVVARAQQAVIGWLSGRNSETDAYVLPAFRRGLNGQGYVEGRNVRVPVVGYSRGSTAGSRGRPRPPSGSRYCRARRHRAGGAGSSSCHHVDSDCPCHYPVRHRFQSPRRQRYRCEPRFWRAGGEAHRVSARSAAPRHHDCCFGYSLKSTQGRCAGSGASARAADQILDCRHRPRA